MSSEPNKIAPHVLYRSTDTQEDYFSNRRALTANHQEEMIRDGLRRLKTILVWTDAVLGEQNVKNDFEQSIVEFFERVKGGLFLCRLANTICPNSIHMKGRSQKATFNKRTNVIEFTNWCTSTFYLNEYNIFTIDDLSESLNVSKIIETFEFIALDAEKLTGVALEKPDDTDYQVSNDMRAIFIQSFKRNELHPRMKYIRDRLSQRQFSAKIEHLMNEKEKEQQTSSQPTSSKKTSEPTLSTSNTTETKHCILSTANQSTELSTTKKEGKPNQQTLQRNEKQAIESKSLPGTPKEKESEKSCQEYTPSFKQEKDKSYVTPLKQLKTEECSNAETAQSSTDTKMNNKENDLKIPPKLSSSRKYEHKNVKSYAPTRSISSKQTKENTDESLEVQDEPDTAPSTDGAETKHISKTQQTFSKKTNTTAYAVTECKHKKETNDGSENVPSNSQAKRPIETPVSSTNANATLLPACRKDNDDKVKSKKKKKKDSKGTEDIQIEDNVSYTSEPKGDNAKEEKEESEEKDKQETETEAEATDENDGKEEEKEGKERENDDKNDTKQVNTYPQEICVERKSKRHKSPKSTTTPAEEAFRKKKTISQEKSSESSLSEISRKSPLADEEEKETENDNHAFIKCPSARDKRIKNSPENEKSSKNESKHTRSLLSSTDYAITDDDSIRQNTEIIPDHTPASYEPTKDEIKKSKDERKEGKKTSEGKKDERQSKKKTLKERPTEKKEKRSYSDSKRDSPSLSKKEPFSAEKNAEKEPEGSHCFISFSTRSKRSEDTTSFKELSADETHEMESTQTGLQLQEKQEASSKHSDTYTPTKSTRRKPSRGNERSTTPVLETQSNDKGDSIAEQCKTAADAGKLRRLKGYSATPRLSRTRKHTKTLSASNSQHRAKTTISSADSAAENKDTEQDNTEHHHHHGSQSFVVTPTQSPTMNRAKLKRRSNSMSAKELSEALSQSNVTIVTPPPILSQPSSTGQSTPQLNKRGVNTISGNQKKRTPSSLEKPRRKRKDQFRTENLGMVVCCRHEALFAPPPNDAAANMFEDNFVPMNVINLVERVRRVSVASVCAASNSLRLDDRFVELPPLDSDGLEEVELLRLFSLYLYASRLFTFPPNFNSAQKHRAFQRIQNETKERSVSTLSIIIAALPLKEWSQLHRVAIALAKMLSLDQNDDLGVRKKGTYGTRRRSKSTSIQLEMMQTDKVCDMFGVYIFRDLVALQTARTDDNKKDSVSIGAITKNLLLNVNAAFRQDLRLFRDGTLQSATPGVLFELLLNDYFNEEISPNFVKEFLITYSFYLGCSVCQANAHRVMVDQLIEVGVRSQTFFKELITLRSHDLLEKKLESRKIREYTEGILKVKLGLADGKRSKAPLLAAVLSSSRHGTLTPNTWRVNILLRHKSASIASRMKKLVCALLETLSLSDLLHHTSNLLSVLQLRDRIYDFNSFVSGKKLPVKCSGLGFVLDIAEASKANGNTDAYFGIVCRLNERDVYRFGCDSEIKRFERIRDDFSKEIVFISSMDVMNTPQGRLSEVPSIDAILKLLLFYETSAPTFLPSTTPLINWTKMSKIANLVQCVQLFHRCNNEGKSSEEKEQAIEVPEDSLTFALLGINKKCL